MRVGANKSVMGTLEKRERERQRERERNMYKGAKPQSVEMAALGIPSNQMLDGVRVRRMCVGLSKSQCDVSLGENACPKDCCNQHLTSERKSTQFAQK